MPYAPKQKGKPMTTTVARLPVKTLDRESAWRYFLAANFTDQEIADMEAIRAETAHLRAGPR